MPTEPAHPLGDLEAIEREIRELEKISHEPQTQERLHHLRWMVEMMRGQEADKASAAPSAWQRVQLARHPQRPYFLDFVELLFQDFSEIHGDRTFGDDTAIVCG